MLSALALALTILQAAAQPQTPAELLTQDIHAQIAKGDLVGFEVLQNNTQAARADLLYTLSYVKGHSIVRNANRASYEKKNGVWVLTQVTPIDRQVQFVEDADVRTSENRAPANAQ